MAPLSLSTTPGDVHARLARPLTQATGGAWSAKQTVPYAIHIVRQGSSRADFTLIETERLRGSFAAVQHRARAFLLGYPDLMSADFVIVRVAADGREVFRWPPDHEPG